MVNTVREKRNTLGGVSSGSSPALKCHLPSDSESSWGNMCGVKGVFNIPTVVM